MHATFYQTKRTKLEELIKQFPGQDSCLIVSVEGPGRQGMAGRICAVTLDNAARCIVEGTHRLASESEAKDYRDEQAAARARCAPATTLDAARQQFRALMKERGHV